MSYLIREGMRPITEGSADTWRECSGHGYSPNDKPLKGAGVTPEQFVSALDAIGVVSRISASSFGMMRLSCANTSPIWSCQTSSRNKERHKPVIAPA